ncbi:secondary thiamine-phosphate synthase enzyme YjbQ [Halothermothrix orenii]|uniref:Secondary thiamine-phosphate synthase enzyme n=1 Tax=Halothermothrix orenii (strain H 168 / OCM 544 / DSM 9562) TaxID=373903 RepID=B8D083_HALOH|nr:secondary thiamine-phosphate synthase enzyme YjbQ [Halothermothrix orenii]ACL68837.1 conserved hypothetical protein [Halothermothrix orenii H 168]
MFKEFHVKTTGRVQLIDITDKVRDCLNEAGIENGILTVFTPHTTAAITINENADPDVKRDIISEINKVIPFDDNYKHLEGNSAAHIKSSLFGVSESIIINNKRMRLGRWQGIYFCEFDGPRRRKVYVQIIGK